MAFKISKLFKKFSEERVIPPDSQGDGGSGRLTCSARTGFRAVTTPLESVGADKGGRGAGVQHNMNNNIK